MRVLLVHPTYWPEVRRGSERVVHDLSVQLAALGHEVTILTSHRARPVTTVEEGVEVIRAWRPPGAPPLRHYEFFTHNTPNVFARLAGRGSGPRPRWDVAQAFFPSDAWAVAWATKYGGPPLVYTHHGFPTREYLVSKRYRLEMIRFALQHAGEATVLSPAAGELFRRYLQVEPVVLPAGVITSSFRSDVARDPLPTLVCAADLADPRKRGPLLREAFGRLRRVMPDVRLVLALGGEAARGAGDGSGPSDGIEVVRCDDTASLAEAYAGAWATVLPSVQEALGLVTLESQASGTPVVAARSGASPALIEDGSTGVLFEPDDAGSLASALERGLSLGRAAETADACRAAAARYDWSTLAERYVDVYERVIGGSRPRLLSPSSASG